MSESTPGQQFTTEIKELVVRWNRFIDQFSGFIIDISICHFLFFYFTPVKEKWDKSKKNECINDATTNTSMAQAGCEQASTLDIEVEVARRVSEARQLWETTGLAKALAEERATLESTLQSRLETAKETWRQTELKTALAEVAAIKAREDGDVLKARVSYRIFPPIMFFI